MRGHYCLELTQAVRNIKQWSINEQNDFWNQCDCGPISSLDLCRDSDRTDTDVSHLSIHYLTQLCYILSFVMHYFFSMVRPVARMHLPCLRKINYWAPTNNFIDEAFVNKFNTENESIDLRKPVKNLDGHLIAKVN